MTVVAERVFGLNMELISSFDRSPRPEQWWILHLAVASPRLREDLDTVRSEILAFHAKGKQSDQWCWGLRGTAPGTASGQASPDSDDSSDSRNLPVTAAQLSRPPVSGLRSNAAMASGQAVWGPSGCPSALGIGFNDTNDLATASGQVASRTNDSHTQ